MRLTRGLPAMAAADAAGAPVSKPVTDRIRKVGSRYWMQPTTRHVLLILERLRNASDSSAGPAAAASGQTVQEALVNCYFIFMAPCARESLEKKDGSE